MLQEPSIWQQFEKMPGQANAASIIGFLLSVLTVGVSVFGWYKRKLNKLEIDKQELLTDRARKDGRIAELTKQKVQLEEQLASAVSRHPESVLARATREWEDGNLWKGHTVLRAWLDTDGKSLATIFFRQGMLLSASMIGDERVAGLAAAQATLIAALVSNPSHLEAASGLKEVESLLDGMGSPPPPLPSCLEHADNHFQQMPLATLESLKSLATVAAKEAQEDYDKGFSHVARISAELAAEMFRLVDGSDSRTFLRSRSFLALPLCSLGRYSEAVTILRSVVERQTDLPGIGPEDLETLESQYRLAGALNFSGETAEAFRTARSLLRTLRNHPAAGPQGRLTYLVHLLYGQVLQAGGLLESAVAELLELKSYLEDDEGINPEDPILRDCRVVLTGAASIAGLGDLATAQLDKIVTSVISDPAFPDPDKLVAMGVVLSHAAQEDLHEMKSSLEAVIALQTSHPALGSYHPATISNKKKMGDVLRRLGKHMDALDITEGAIAATRLMPEAETTAANKLRMDLSKQRAAILDESGRTEEALDELRREIETNSGRQGGEAASASLFSSRLYFAELLIRSNQLDEATAQLTVVKDWVLGAPKCDEVDMFLSKIEGLESDVLRRRFD